MSMRRRLLLWLMPPIVVLACFWVWATYSIVLRFADLAYDRALEDTVLTIAGQVRAERGEVTVDLPPAARRMIEFDQVDRVFYSISDAGGRLLAGNFDLPRHPRPAGGSTDFYDGAVGADPIRLAEYRIDDGSGRAGAALSVRVAETVHKRTILAREVSTYMIIPQLLFIAAISVLVWYGVGVGIEPLRRVRDAIAARSPEDMSPLEESALPSEVHEQVHVINGLMDRLSRTLRSQRRFIADATHHLRTPITVLKAQTELALRSTDYASMRDALDRIRASTERLARLANQLLNLSRAEPGPDQKINLTPLPMREVAEEVVAGLVPAALAKDIEVTVDFAGDALIVDGDRQLCAEMLANLVDNAIRYTPRGGRVQVKLESSREHAVITVADNGPGIAAEARERVFERFYRAHDHTSEGTGLGLAIAREIALTHAGRIALSGADGGAGLTVVIEVPLSKARASPEGTARPAEPQ
jgi:two-component system sensor histidine kinase TctE